MVSTSRFHDWKWHFFTNSRAKKENFTITIANHDFTSIFGRFRVFTHEQLLEHTSRKNNCPPSVTLSCLSIVTYIRSHTVTCQARRYNGLHTECSLRRLTSDTRLGQWSVASCPRSHHSSYGLLKSQLYNTMRVGYNTLNDTGQIYNGILPPWTHAPDLSDDTSVNNTVPTPLSPLYTSLEVRCFTITFITSLHI